jgi:predicted ABC-type ATPase
VVVAGPNGAGKTTVAPPLLNALFDIKTYVNADTIAQGLAGFDPESASLAAGRVMLARLKELAWQRAGPSGTLRLLGSLSLLSREVETLN